MAGANSKSAPNRFSFVDPKHNKSAQESPRDQSRDMSHSLPYKHNNAANLGLDLDSVWSIERNVKVKSSLSSTNSTMYGKQNRFTAPNRPASDFNTSNRNFYSRYTSNKDGRGLSSVPSPHSSGYRTATQNSAGSGRYSGSDRGSGGLDRLSGSGDGSAGLERHSPMDRFSGQERNSSAGRRPVPGDPLSDDFW